VQPRRPFEDRIGELALPSSPAVERPGVSEIERAPDGWRLTRRNLIAVLAAGAVAGFPRAAYAQVCSTGAYAHQIFLESLSFFPDGKTMVSAGRDGFVKFWTIPGAALFRTIATDAVPLQVVVSPDGTQIAVAMTGGRLELWSADGATRRALAGHTDSIQGVAFTPDGSRLVSVSLDRTTKVWSVLDGQLLNTFADKSDVMNRVAAPKIVPRTLRIVKLRIEPKRPAAPSAQALLVTSGAQLHLRLIETGAIQQTVAGKAFAISLDGKYLAAQDGVRLYMYAFPSLVSLVTVVENQSATSLSFSADGKLLAVTYANAPARVYSAPDLTLAQQLAANEGPALASAVDAQNRYLAIASGKSIRLYALPACARTPVCFMDLAASAPSATGIRYVWGGVGYTVGCGASIPSGAVCTCDCVPGDCSCVSDTGCACDADSGCGCDSDNGCTCVSDAGCTCVGDAGCLCDSDYGCGCVDDMGCGCDGDAGCGCVGDSGCGCVGDSGCADD